MKRVCAHQRTSLWYLVRKLSDRRVAPRERPLMATVFDLEVQDLPDGWTPLEAVTVVTCLNEDGD